MEAQQGPEGRAALARAQAHFEKGEHAAAEALLSAYLRRRAAPGR